MEYKNYENEEKDSLKIVMMMEEGMELRRPDAYLSPPKRRCCCSSKGVTIGGESESYEGGSSFGTGMAVGMGLGSAM